MKRKLLGLFIQHRTAVYVGFIVIVVTIGVIGYYYSGRITEEKVAEQMLHREQVIVRAGAKSIESFIVLSKNSLLVLSRSPRLLELNETTQTALDNFTKDWEGTPLVTAIVVDSKGKVISIAGKAVTDEDRAISFIDRDYFKWAKTAKSGEVFIGESVQARVSAYKGQSIITLATPVIENNEFKGVLVSAILISKLTENYLDPLKISEQSKVYLVTDSGLVIYSDISSLIGINLLNYLEENPFTGSELIIKEIRNRFEKVTREGEGKMVYVRNDYDDKLNLKKWLLAYSAVHITTTSKQENWILVVETPNSDAMLYSGSFFRNQTLVLVFFILVIVVITCIGIFTSRIEARDAYLKGFHQGQKAKRT